MPVSLFTAPSPSGCTLWDIRTEKNQEGTRYREMARWQLARMLRPSVQSVWQTTDFYPDSLECSKNKNGTVDIHAISKSGPCEIGTFSFFSPKETKQEMSDLFKDIHLVRIEPALGPRDPNLPSRSLSSLGCIPFMWTCEHSHMGMGRLDWAPDRSINSPSLWTTVTSASTHSRGSKWKVTAQSSYSTSKGLLEARAQLSDSLEWVAGFVNLMEITWEKSLSEELGWSTGRSVGECLN